MAQWAGQYTGRTHATADVDAESLLVRAIAAFSAADAETRVRHAKQVVRLAKRLLTVRRRRLKARVEDQQAIHGATDADDDLRRLEEGGIAAILAAYGGLAALTPGPDPR